MKNPDFGKVLADLKTDLNECLTNIPLMGLVILNGLKQNPKVAEEDYIQFVALFYAQIITDEKELLNLTSNEKEKDVLRGLDRSVVLEILQFALETDYTDINDIKIRKYRTYLMGRGFPTEYLIAKVFEAGIWNIRNILSHNDTLKSSDLKVIKGFEALISEKFGDALVSPAAITEESSFIETRTRLFDLAVSYYLILFKSKILERTDAKDNPAEKKIFLDKEIAEFEKLKYGRKPITDWDYLALVYGKYSGLDFENLNAYMTIFNASAGDEMLLQGPTSNVVMLAASKGLVVCLEELKHESQKGDLFRKVFTVDIINSDLRIEAPTLVDEKLQHGLSNDEVKNFFEILLQIPQPPITVEDLNYWLAKDFYTGDEYSNLEERILPQGERFELIKYHVFHFYYSKKLKNRGKYVEMLKKRFAIEKPLENIQKTIGNLPESYKTLIMPKLASKGLW